MFRKGGGANMNGIMSGITDREMHADSDEQGVGGQTFKDEVQNRIDLIQSVSGGSKGLDDPLTQFLLSYGPAIATQRPTGNLLGTIVGAAKEPTENLFKNIQAEKKLKTGVALEVLDSLEETQEQFEISMAGLLDQKDNYGSPFLNTYSAEKVAKAIDDVKKNKVAGISFDDIDLDLPYLRKDVDYTTDEASGKITLSEDDIGTYREGSVIFDYRTNKYFRVNGAQLIPIGA
jgi:hypothetical protein